MEELYNIILVGCGGTGGHFLTNFGRFLQSYGGGRSYYLTIIDGDMVERSNLTRQPFLEEDIGKNKAEAFAEIYSEVYGIECSFCNQYVDTPEDILKLTDKTGLTLLIGAVDNHACRKILHEVFQGLDSCIYIDSANEFSVGEIVVGVKMGGIILYPDRTFYFPDVLTDQSVSKSQQSCMELNASTPQHLVTNLMAANLLLMIVVTIMADQQMIGGMFLFDAFKGYCNLENVGESYEFE